MCEFSRGGEVIAAFTSGHMKWTCERGGKRKPSTCVSMDGAREQDWGV